MSLDIHKLKNGRPGKCLLSIGDAEYFELLPAFRIFKSKTGLTIDQYTDLKLSSGLSILIESVEAKSNGSTVHSSLLKVLRQSEENGQGIIFIGE
jgi:hypothetical protein